MSERDVEMMHAIEEAVYKEIGARNFYRKIGDRIKNSEGKEKFLRLSEDEDGHRIKLESWLKKLYDVDFVAEPERTAQSEIECVRVDEEAGALEALNIAIEAEARAKEFYSKQAGNTDDPELKALFLNLADEENGHYNLLEAERNSLIGGFYWFDIDSTSFLED